MAISVHVRPPVTNNTYSNGVLDSSTIGHSSHSGSFSNLAGKPDSPTAVAAAAAGVGFSVGGGGGTSRLSPTMIPRKASIIPLANMSTARCAMGAVELDGKLVVCGEWIVLILPKKTITSE